MQAYINADPKLESSANALSEYLTAKYNAQIIDDMQNAPFIVTLTTDAAALPANKSKFRVAEGCLTLQFKQNTAKSKNLIAINFDREKENGMSDAQAIGNVLECFADGIADGYRARLDEEFDKLNITMYSIEQ